MANNPKRYRKLFTSTLMSAMVIGGALSPIGNTANAANNQVSFSDLKSGQEGYQAVASLVNKDIIKGYEDGHFAPFASLSREHVAVMLANALNLSKPSDISSILSSYSDVNTHDRYGSQIAAVTKAGIFKGNHGHFNPNKPITREQIATVLVNAFDLKGTTDNVTFSDSDQLSPSHKNNVNILAENGITIGKPDGHGHRMYNGHGPVKRVQFAIFLDKAMKAIKAAPTANISLGLDKTGTLPTGLTMSTDSKLKGDPNNKDKYTLLKGVTGSQVNLLKLNSDTNISSDAKPGVYPIKLTAINGSTDLQANNSAIKQFDEATGAAKDYLNGAADGTNPYGMIKIDDNGQVSLLNGYQYSVDKNTPIGMMIPNGFPAGHYTFEVDIPNVYGQVTKKKIEIDIAENANVDLALDHTGAVPSGFTEASDSTLTKTSDSFYELTEGANSSEVNGIKLADTTKFSSNIKPGNYQVKLVGIDGSADLSKMNSKLLAFDSYTGPAKTYLDSAAAGDNAYGILKINDQHEGTLVDGYRYSIDPNTTSPVVLPNGFPKGVYTFKATVNDIYNTPLNTYFSIKVK